MHAKELCHKWLSNVLPGMHQKRLSALSAVVGGAFKGRRLNVTSLGRSIGGSAKIKHSIKRADRLLSNSHLHSERFEAYSALSHEIIGKTERPVILVDWSDIDARRKFYLIRASVAVQGRSLTLYEEVHTVSTKEKPKTHAEFLKNLQCALPQGCRPIIITDAGFRGPWFRQVGSLGWDYIGRVRNREMVQTAQKAAWIGAKILYEQATRKAKLFSNVYLTRSKPLSCSLVLFKEKPKGRIRLTKMGKKARHRTSQVNSTRAREPWLLATSLTIKPGEQKRIVQLYSTRMQIEESFRDLKCPRYGLGLYNNGTYKIERMRILVLIGSIANTFAWFLGKVVRTLCLHRQYQANTAIGALSNVFIGTQVFSESRLKIPWTQFHEIKKTISPVQLKTQL